MGTEYAIECLTDENYLMWSNLMQLNLEGKGLWKYVDGTFTEEEGEENITQQMEMSNCLAEILLNLDMKHLKAVVMERNPEKMWNILKEMHKGKSTSVLTLRMRLHRMKMEENQTVECFVEAIRDIEDELRRHKHEVAKIDKKLVLLNGLPDEFSFIKTVLLCRDLSYEEMVHRLTIAEITMTSGKHESE